ncbi:MAG TPA: LacI family DNA-binding transcriptional regulator [Mycobacteriales bacterium]|nr:LacI family DNA-binding transcriptional regulator [Mycobacteriales bacterium]
MSDPERATLASVARQARVSRQTVSNVLNAPERVRPATRERVLAVIDRQDYRPHQAARQLRTRRSRVIGLRIEPVRDGVNGVVLDRFLHALTATAQDAGYRIMLFTAADDAAEVRAYDELISTLDTDAFVLTSTHHGDERTAWLRDHRVPFVTFGRPWGAENQHSWVDVDGAAGTRAAVEHLVALGHRRIAFVGWPRGSGVGDDRWAGWRDGLAAHSLPARGLDVQVLDGIEPGRRAAAQLLGGSTTATTPGARRAAGQPTGFVCASDSLALGVLAELQHRGLRPGTDAAVIGFDDTPASAVIGLSSVTQPIAEVAVACVLQLRPLLDSDPDSNPDRDPTDRARQLLLPPVLAVRTSSAAPPP